MMSLRPLALAVLLVSAAAPPAAAQAQPAAAEAAQQHMLEIRDGRMHLDGRALPPENLPEGLDLRGIEMTYSFVGPVSPVLEIDGVVYVLEGEHFKRLSETERAGVQPYFFPEAPPSQGPTRAQASESEEAYLRQLSERDQALYGRIQREMELERETLQLADRIRNTSDPGERERLVQRLREKLTEAFELKEAIRAEEIDQAEEQLDELRRLLHGRAARKDSIIERRMEELIGDQ